MKVVENEQKNPTLSWAWQWFGLYDSNAGQTKPVFLRFQTWILMLGVLATFLILLQEQLMKQEVFAPDSIIKKIFQYTIVALPIVLSVLVAASNRFKPG